MSLQYYEFGLALARYPIETITFLLLTIGPIMIYFGANRDTKGNITNYSSTVSIFGWIMTVVGILAFSYYIYYYYIAKHK
jgi:hypothetical protein